MKLPLSIAVLIVAGAASQAAAAPPAANACGLLTRDEAAAVVGAPVAEGKPLKGDMGQGIDVQNCTYTAPGAKELRVNLWRFGPRNSQGLEMYRGLCRQKEQASGLGDLACWYNAEHRELQVLKGTSLLILELTGRRGATDALMAAAKQALGRVQ